MRPPAERTLALPDATPTFAAPAAWGAIDFISDLHLAENTPAVFDAWAAHLRHTRADAVFILGDLFEVWIGDDMAERGFEATCVSLLREAASRIAVGFMAGNRDFFVGDALLEANGVMRLQDPTVIEAFGARTLVSHGDALCLSDLGYQRFRRVVRAPMFQRTFLGLPLSWRRAIGRTARRRSEAMHDPKAYRFYDVDGEAASGWLASTQSPTLVHGHTHAPASHVMDHGAVRHVLSDWHLDGPGATRAEVLRWTADGFQRIAPETSAARAQSSAAPASSGSEPP